MTAIRPTAAPALRVAPKAAASAPAAPKAAPAQMAGDSLHVTRTQAAKPAAPAAKNAELNAMPVLKKVAIGVGTVAVAGAIGYAGAMVGGLGTAIIVEKFVSGASAIVGAGLWGALIGGAGGLIGGGLLGNKWMNKLIK